MINKYFLPFSLILIANIAFSQHYRDIILSEVYIDTAMVRQNKIRSAHVFSERIEDYHYNGEVYTIGNKREEREYDELGRPVYRRATSGRDMSYALGDKGTTHEKYTFDEQNRVIKSCVLKDMTAYCNQYTYDKDGNLTSIRNDGKHVRNGLLTFEWKDGEMVKAVNTDLEEDNYYLERKFDKKGRVIEFKSGDRFKTTFEYIDSETEVKTITKSFIFDSLTRMNESVKLKATDQLLFYCEIDWKKDTLNKLIVKYDNNHNISGITFVDYSDFLNDIVDYPPIESEGNNNSKKRIPRKPEPTVNHFRIVNSYTNGLISRRVVYRTKQNSEEELVMIDRIIYEDQPLLIKSWPLREEDRSMDGDDIEMYEEEEPVPPVQNKDR